MPIKAFVETENVFMSNDISTQYTKERNKKCGRNGYYAAHKEKVNIISPLEYGMFIEGKKRKRR